MVERKMLQCFDYIITKFACGWIYSEFTDTTPISELTRYFSPEVSNRAVCLIYGE